MLISSDDLYVKKYNEFYLIKYKNNKILRFQATEKQTHLTKLIFGLE